MEFDVISLCRLEVIMMDDDTELIPPGNLLHFLSNGCAPLQAMATNWAGIFLPYFVRGVDKLRQA